MPARKGQLRDSHPLSPPHNNNNPHLQTSIIALTLAAGIIGLAAIMSMSSSLPDLLGTVDSPARGFAAIFVFVPAMVLLACVFLGGVLALLEGWDFLNGFKYLVALVRVAEAF